MNLTEKKSKREIKVNALCGRCNKIHSAEGLGGIVVVLKSKKGHGYTTGVGVFSIYKEEELLALIVALLVSLYKEFPKVLIQAIVRFTEDSGAGIVKKIKLKPETIN